MSDGKQDAPAQPLVIVRRRRGGGEEAHHGGVWKIAYADFMTAMMAFFLVMWLVNAADKKTIVQVAAYFNPVRLTDKTPSSPGLENPSSSDAKAQPKKAPDSKAQDAHKAPSKDPLNLAGAGAAIGVKEKAEKPESELSKSSGQAHKDEALFSDPMGVLDKLASKVTLMPAAPTKTDSPKSVLRDPFEPGHRGGVSAARPQNAKPDQMTGEATAEGKGKTKNKPKTDVKPDAKTDPAVSDVAAKELKEAEQRDEASALEAEIKRSFAMIGNDVPNAEVKATAEGILISLTDKADFGMFAVGSAEPRPELVVAVAKLAELLKARTGALVIRGHTDARQYRNGSYDNWRLSSARAQMSYHMLVRGGVDAMRITAIEGRADRDLKVASDKESALNRRIDVLIKAPQS